VHEFLRKNVFRLSNQDTTQGSTSPIEMTNVFDQGDVHVETARERNIENGSVKQARQPVNE